MRQRVEASIARPPADVFDFVARHHWRNHPRWDPNVLEIRPVEPGGIGVGSRARVRRKRGAGDELLEVVRYDPDARWVSRTQIGPFSLVMTALIEPTGTGKSRLALIADTEARYPLRHLLPVLAPVFRRRMRASVARIKHILESEGSP
jgi:polyketide cyclase/dehydrase/lipid transport protein